VEGLPLAVVVDARPGEDGPEVVELPVQAAHARWGVTPDRFDTQTYPEGLHTQGQVSVVVHIIWLARLEQLLGVLLDNLRAPTHLVVILDGQGVVGEEILFGQELLHAGHG